MSETGDLSDSEIQILSEEVVALSVVRGRGRVGDFLQSFVDGETVFKLTSVTEVDMIGVEECALEFLTESVVVVILKNCLGDVSFVGSVELVRGYRTVSCGESS